MRTLLTILLASAGLGALADEWQQLPSFPDKEGFAGSFAGVSNGALLVAGGANFPGKKPWEGGEKVWYDTVFVLENPSAKWKIAGRLPRPLGYGVSVTYNGGLVCVGGSDNDRHYANVFRLEWRNGKLVTTALPPLPKPIANSCGALVGGVLYVAGGLDKPDSITTSKQVWKIDLGSMAHRWKKIDACPGSGRMLAVAAGFDDALWLVGGVDLGVGKSGNVDRHYLKDAYRYDPLKGWKRIADLPHSVVAAPSPAPVGNDGFYLLGGDDGSQVRVPPDKHLGFSTTGLRYDATTDSWIERGKVVAPRATVPCVFWNMAWVLPGGEVRPGVRSSEVWSWKPEKPE